MRDVFGRLLEDLRRPGGGWTVGFATIFGAMGVLLAGILGVWPWPPTSVPIALALFAFHVGWGAAGYYPRRF